MANISPSARIELIDALLKKLYNSSNLYRDKTLNQLIKDNSAIYDNDQLCFSFKNTIFQASDFRGKYPLPINKLAPIMRDSFRDYISFAEQTKNEKLLVLGYLQRLVTVSRRAADYSALMPKQLHYLINDIKLSLEPGDGLLTAAEIESFKQNNSKYIEMLKTRLTMNLINAP